MQLTNIWFNYPLKCLPLANLEQNKTIKIAENGPYL